MIKKTVTYEDYNGITRTETFYFHFNEAEILDMELGTEGGFAERIQRIIGAKDQTSLLKVIKKFVLDAYGVKSEDGRRFIKSEEVKEAFVECPAYSEVYLNLLSDDAAAAEFVNGVIPSNLKDRFEKLAKKAYTN